MSDQIQGGHFLISRKVFDSAIWQKPPQYYRLLSWLIGKAVFRSGHIFKGHILKRGELIATYREIANALSYRLNRATIKPTLKEIRIMLSWLQSEGMILLKPLTGGTLPNQGRPKDFTGAYIGMLIFIVNYDTYQDSKSYKGSNKGRPKDEQGQTEEEREEECITPRDFSSEISALKKRYSDQETIDQAFQAIASTRKSKRIADSVKLNILQSWERYPVESVISGIKTYLDKGYHRQEGKGEKYLLGIIRNITGTGTKDAPEGQIMKASGSPLLDGHFRSQGYRII